MAVVPDQLQAPQGGLNQVAQAPAPKASNPTKEAESATIDESPEDPIATAMQKMALDRKKLDDQISKLSSSLEARTNLPFNPMWLDVARAAAKPASTGNAIEALGNIGGAYGDAYLKENQRQIDIGKDQLDLFKQQQALNQAGLEQQLMYNYVKGSKGQPATAQGPAAPTQGATAAPAAVGKITTAPPPPDVPPEGRMRRITDSDIALYDTVAPKVGEMLKGLSKLQREAQVVSNEGIWDTMSGSWVVKFQMPIERPIRVLGKQPMTKEQSAQYDQLVAQLDANKATDSVKDAVVAEWAAQNGIGGVTKTAQGIQGFVSPQQAALDAEEAKKVMTQKFEENKATRDRIYNAGERSQGTVQSAKVLYNLASNKNTSGTFGVLAKPGVLNAAAVAITQFLDTKGGSFGTAGLEQAVRTAGGTEEQVQAASMAAQVQGYLQLMAAQDFLKGQGAVSDAERRLVANLVGSLSDPPKAVAMKAKVVEARANFDKLVSDAFYEFEKANPSATVQDFYRQSKEYKDLFNEYDQHMTNLYAHYFPSSAPQSKPVTPTESKAASTPSQHTPKQGMGPLERRIRESQQKAGS